MWQEATIPYRLGLLVVHVCGLLGRQSHSYTGCSCRQSLDDLRSHLSASGITWSARKRHLDRIDIWLRCARQRDPRITQLRRQLVHAGSERSSRVFPVGIHVRSRAVQARLESGTNGCSYLCSGSLSFIRDIILNPLTSNTRQYSSDRSNHHATQALPQQQHRRSSAQHHCRCGRPTAPPTRRQSFQRPHTPATRQHSPSRRLFGDHSPPPPTQH